MNLKKIEAFVLILEKGSFSVAAENLGMTQPAVSTQVKSLEQDLGVKLIERRSSSIQATPAGTYVYNLGRQLLDLSREMEEGVKNFQGVLTGKLRIGASTIPGTYLLPKWIGNFYNLFPKVEVINEIADSKQILDRLMNRQIHLSITGDKSDSTEIHSELIATDSLVLISPNGHPLTSSEYKNNEADLRKYNFVLREQGSGTRKSMEAGLKSLGVRIEELHIVAQLGSTEAVISAVEEGVGISYVSNLAATPAINANRVQLVSNIKAFNQKYYLSYLKGTQASPTIKEFINVVSGI